MLNLPEAFLKRMQTILKADYNKFLLSLNESEVKGIYVNENKIDVNSFARLANFKIEKIPFEPAGFYIDAEKKGKHPLHHAGAFYVQDPSAMFTVNAYKFKGNETVLDMCAAPGGKTIQLANKLANGVVVSNEINKSRCEVLYSNVERMGLKNVVIANETPQNLAKAYANVFDVCLVDAPCSGEGMFRRGNQVVEEWNENLPKMCAKRQLEILENANACLKQNGILIYSTCTYSYEENEGVVSEFLLRHNYKLVNIDAPFMRGIGLAQAVRLYPFQNKGEGQFVAVLQKKEANLLNYAPTLKLKTNEIVQNFIKNNLNVKLNLYDYKNFTYNITNQSVIKQNVNYISLGVRVATVKNKIVVPHHYLFSAFGKNFNKTLNLDFSSPMATKYLHGDTLLDQPQDGYGAILINNCPLGGYKISASKFKNLYPKGLRNC